TLSARYESEQYPNYEAVITVENDKVLTVERDALKAAVERVAMFSSSMTHQIRLALSPSEVVVSAEDIERAKTGSEAVPCAFDGGDMDVWLNSDYLGQVLQNLRGEEARVLLSSPNRALLFDDDSARFLLMP